MASQLQLLQGVALHAQDGASSVSTASKMQDHLDARLQSAASTHSDGCVIARHLSSCIRSCVMMVKGLCMLACSCAPATTHGHRPQTW
jgi:hypothetical protein